MIIAKVISRVVATAKLDTIPARQLLSVVPIQGFADTGVPFIVLDSVQAGPGDTVLVLQEGTGARQATEIDAKQPLPAQMVIVGIIDQIQRSNEQSSS